MARPSGESVPPREDHAAFLLGLVTQQTDLTLEEIVAAMTKVGISGSCTTVRHFCERHGFSFPKKPLHAQQRRRAEMARARRPWIREQSLPGPAQLVIDETCAGTAMAGLRVCSHRGRHLIACTPHGHGMTTTFVTGLRLRKGAAPFVLDGARNGRMFHAYAKQRRAPRLKRGDIAIMDNLPVRKVARVCETIEVAGAMPLCLLPYSPDLNLIETAFRKFEARLRKAAKRTIPALLHTSPLIPQNVGISCATPAMFKHHRNLLLKCSE